MPWSSLRPLYSETDLTGGGFGLSYNGRSSTDTRGELGARFDRAMLASPDAALTLRARLAWAHDWVSDPSLTAIFQALPGASFVVNGATPAKDAALASAGAELRFQVRRRVRQPRADLHGHGHAALQLVIWPHVMAISLVDWPFTEHRSDQSGEAALLRAR
jgi:hypothetical protein